MASASAGSGKLAVMKELMEMEDESAFLEIVGKLCRERLHKEGEEKSKMMKNKLESVLGRNSKKRGLDNESVESCKRKKHCPYDRATLDLWIERLKKGVGDEDKYLFTGADEIELLRRQSDDKALYQYLAHISPKGMLLR